MKTAVPREVRRMFRQVVRPLQACVLLLSCVGAASAADPDTWASASATFQPMAPAPGGATPVPGSLIEIRSSKLPRFDNFDGTSRTQQRLDMALLSPGRSSFGVSMGVSGPGPSSINLGLQWRYVFNETRRVDIMAWRDMGRPNDALAMIHSRDPSYGAKVEMKLASSRSPLLAERGFVGLGLSGGARITIKRSMGQPMLYYRNQF